MESPEQVAALVRRALKLIPPERLILSSDCGMGREGMSRRHAFYKMVALVLGVNIVKKELGPAGCAESRRGRSRVSRFCGLLRTELRPEVAE